MLLPDSVDPEPQHLSLRTQTRGAGAAVPGVGDQGGCAGVSGITTGPQGWKCPRGCRLNHRGLAGGEC